MPHELDRHSLNEEAAKEILADNKAVLIEGFDGISTSIWGDEELIRGWEESVPDYFGELKECLNRFTSASNASPQHYVDNIVIQGVVYDGRWRQAFVRRVKRGGSHFIVQVLRRGFITTVKQGANLDWSEARLEESRNLPGDGGANPETEYLTVRWPNVATTHASRVQEELKAFAQGSFNPVVFGEGATPYGAGWHRLQVAARSEDDGSVTVMLFLANPEYTFEAYSSWETKTAQDVTYHYSVPQALAQAIVTAHKGKGKSATVSQPSQLGLVNITLFERDYTGEILLDEVTLKNCSIIETTSYYWGIEDATTYNIPGTVPAGWTYRKDIRDNGDGSFDVVISGRHAQYQKIDTYTQQDNSARTVEHTRHSNVTNGVAETGALPTDSQGVGVTIRKTKNDDCSEDVDVQEETAKSQVSNSSVVASGFTDEIVRTTNQNAEPAQPTAEQNKIKTTRSEQTDLQQFNTEESERTFEELTGAGGTNAPGYYETETINENAPEQAVAADEPQAINTVTNQPNDHGSWTQRIRRRVNILREATGDRLTAAVETAFYNFRNRSTLLPSGTRADGTIRIVDQTQGDDGKFSGRREVQVAQKQDGSVQVETPLLNEEHTIKSNLTVAEANGYDITLVERGKIKIVRKSENDFGRVDTESIEKVARNMTVELQTYPTRYGTASVRRVRNASTTDADANNEIECPSMEADILLLDDSTSNHLSFDINEFGYIDYVITRIPYLGSNVSPTVWAQHTWTRYRVEYRQNKSNGGNHQYRIWTYAFLSRYRFTRSTAFSDANGLGDEKYQSGVTEIVRDKIWRSDKITSITPGDWANVVKNQAIAAP